MMESILLFSFCSALVTLGKAYENIALSKPAMQLHSYNDEWGADKAVDGLKLDLSANGGQCAISADNQLTAEWRDTNYTRDTIPNPTNITCAIHGRYVIFYHNRTHPPYPAGYSEYACNDLCEVEVNGCPTPGFYGEDCSVPCPQNCQEGHCDITEGTCLGCVDGYKGATCNEECLEQNYGLECQQACGNCINKEPCHHVNGSCLNGCSSGFYGNSCNLACPDGRYGYNCQEQCNVTCGVPYRCDRVTGQCQGGCQVGWKGTTCDRECDGSMFGQNCSSVCGRCLEKKQCNNINGSCPIGCESGYQGSHCTQVCTNNTYGAECSIKCGNCLYIWGEQCHHVTGQCPRGCDVGFQGDRCDQAFAPGSSDIESKCKTSTALYVSVAITVLSLSVNAYFIIRQLRNRSVLRQQKNTENADTPIDKRSKDLKPREHFSMSVYDQAEANPAYQELEEITEEYQYDKLS